MLNLDLAKRCIFLIYAYEFIKKYKIQKNSKANKLHFYLAINAISYSVGLLAFHDVTCHPYPRKF